MATNNETIMYLALKDIAETEAFPNEIREIAAGALSRANWEQRTEERSTSNN